MDDKKDATRMTGCEKGLDRLELVYLPASPAPIPAIVATVGADQVVIELIPILEWIGHNRPDILRAAGLDA